MVAVVIGASGTIGEACVTQFLLEDVEVIALDLVEPRINGSTNLTMDVTNRESVREVLQSISTGHEVSALV